MCSLLFILESEVRDLIEELNLLDEQYGVEKIKGRCDNRTQEKNFTDQNYAFRFTNSSDSSLVTDYTFPNTFPTDFSILIVLRQPPGR